MALVGSHLIAIGLISFHFLLNRSTTNRKLVIKICEGAIDQTTNLLFSLSKSDGRLWQVPTGAPDVLVDLKPISVWASVDNTLL